MTEAEKTYKVSCVFDSNLATTINLSMIWAFMLIDTVDQSVRIAILFDNLAVKAVNGNLKVVGSNLTRFNFLHIYLKNLT